MRALLISVLTSILLFGIAKHRAATKSIIQDSKGFAVVELFTSEGCSSCPPADEAVIELANAYKQNVFVIGFHVDYWDQLGWKDSFSNAAYSKRQQQYGNIFQLNSIYTPQIIVNGRTEFVGSDRSRLHRSVDDALKANDGVNIILKATAGNKNTVNINYSLPAISGNVLNIALVELQAQSEVKRGENSGKKLRHINLVRDFKSIATSGEEGFVSFLLPDGLSARDCKVIAYLQDIKDWHVKGATATGIATVN